LVFAESSFPLCDKDISTFPITRLLTAPFGFMGSKESTAHDTILLDGQRGGMMIEAVVTRGNYNQIFYTIIKFVTIDVMHLLIRM